MSARKGVGVAALGVAAGAAWLLASCLVMNGLQVTAARADASDDPTDDGVVRESGARPPVGGGDATSPPAPGRCDPGAKFTQFTPLSELNTTSDEELPRLSPDELSIYFFADLDTDTQIFRAGRPNLTSPFAAPTRVLAAVSDVGEAFPSADGLRLYYAMGSDNLSITLAERTATTDPFAGTRVIVAATPNLSMEYPALYAGPSGPRLLFEQVGQNDSDIFTTDLDPTGAAVSPQPLANVNSNTFDGAPTPSADGLTLYLYSERNLPPDKGRVFVARRASVNDPFGTPTLVDELQPPDGGWVSPGYLSADACRLYFYKADSPRGNADLFVASRTP
jgi:hypothetical protein